MACAAFNFIRKLIRTPFFLCLKLFGHVFQLKVRPVYGLCGGPVLEFFRTDKIYALV